MAFAGAPALSGEVLRRARVRARGRRRARGRALRRAPRCCPAARSPWRPCSRPLRSSRRLAGARGRTRRGRGRGGGRCGRRARAASCRRRSPRRGSLWAAAALALAALAGPKPARALAARRPGAPCRSSRIGGSPAPRAKTRSSRRPPSRAPSRAVIPAGSSGRSTNRRYRPPSALQTRRAGRPSPAARDYSRRVWYLHTQALWGRGTVFNSDLDVGDLSRVDSLRRALVGRRDASERRSVLSALRPALRDSLPGPGPMPGYAAFGGDGLQAWDENPARAPDIRLLERWREEPDALAALARDAADGAGRAGPRDGPRRRARRGRGRARAREEPGAAAPRRLGAGLRPGSSCCAASGTTAPCRSTGVEVPTVPAQLAFTAVADPGGRAPRSSGASACPGVEVSCWGRSRSASSRSGFCGAARAGARLVTRAVEPADGSRHGTPRCRRFSSPRSSSRSTRTRSSCAAQLQRARPDRLQPADGEVDPRRLRARPASGLDAGGLGRAAAAAQPQRRRALSRARRCSRALPFPLAVRIFPVLHWVAAGIGVMLLLRALGALARRRRGSAAVTYAFSGVVVSEVFYPHIQPGMALLPWIVWAAARPRRAPGVAHRSLLAVLFALDFLAADVFTIALAIGARGALDRARERPRDGRSAARAGSPWRSASAALAALPQIVGDGALDSRRPTAPCSGMKLGDVRAISRSHPWRLLELVVPYPFGDDLGARPARRLGLGRSSAAGPWVSSRRSTPARSR